MRDNAFKPFGRFGTPRTLISSFLVVLGLCSAGEVVRADGAGPLLFSSQGLTPQQPYRCMTGQITMVASSLSSFELASRTSRDGLMANFLESDFRTRCEPGPTGLGAPRCSDVAPDGELDNELFFGIVRQHQAEERRVACELETLEQLSAEQQCLEGESQANADAYLRLVSEIFSAGVTQAGPIADEYEERIGISTEKAVEAGKRRAELEAIYYGLDGNGSASGGGLKTEIENAEATLNQVDLSVTNNLRSREVHAEMIQYRTGWWAVEGCFKSRVISGKDTVPADFVAEGSQGATSATSGSGWKVTDPWTAFQYRIRTLFMVGPDGKTVETGRRAESRANLGYSEAVAFLLNLIGKPPSSGDIPDPNNPEAVIAYSQQGIDLTLAEVISAVDARASSLRVGDSDIGAWIKSRMSACFKYAESQVKRELKSKTEDLGRIGAQISDATVSIQHANNDLMTRLSNLYAEAQRALSGNFLPLDVSVCEAADIQTQLNCIKDIYKNLKHVVQGTGVSGEQTAELGSGSSTEIVNCNGVFGCMVAYSNLEKNHGKAADSSREEKADFVREMNDRAIQMVQDASRQLQGVTQLMADHLQSINDRLVNDLGWNPIVFPTYESPSINQLLANVDEHGLIQLPPNLADYVGGGAQPPLMKTTGAAGVMRAIAQGVTELKERAVLANRNSSEALSLRERCGGEPNQDILDQHLENRAEFVRECSRVEEVCGRRERADFLANDLNRIFENLEDDYRKDRKGQYDEDAEFIPGISAGEISILAQGVGDLCREVDTGVRDELNNQEARADAILAALGAFGSIESPSDDPEAPVSSTPTPSVTEIVAVYEADGQEGVAGFMSTKVLSNSEKDQLREILSIQLTTARSRIPELKEETGFSNRERCIELAEDLNKNRRLLGDSIVDRYIAGEADDAI